MLVMRTERILNAELLQTRRLESRKLFMMSGSIIREDENEDLHVNYASDVN